MLNYLIALIRLTLTLCPPLPPSAVVAEAEVAA